MKQLIYFLFVILLFTSCGSKSSSYGKVRGTPPPDTKEAQMLTASNFWVIEFYVSFEDEEQGRANQGKWIQFRKDGTADVGHWEDQTSTGTWTMVYGGKHPLVVLDMQDDTQDIGWEIQGISEPGDEMSWVGVKDYPNYGDVVKVISLLTRPTKKQFGVE